MQNSDRKMLHFISEFSRNMNKYGIQIWFFQNALILIAVILFLSSIPLIWMIKPVGVVLGGFTSFIFYFCLVLDLLAISLIVGFELIAYWNNRSDPSTDLKTLLIPGIGATWVILSFFLRVPFFLRGPYELDLVPRTATDFIAYLSRLLVYLDPPLSLGLLGTSFLFLMFLILLGYPGLVKTDEKKMDSSLRTLFLGYGILNLLGVIPLLIGAVVPDPFLIYESYFSAICLKIGVTPYLGASSLTKYYEWVIGKEKLPAQESKPVRSFKDAFVKITPLFPSLKTALATLAISVILLSVPFSPFFLGNVIPPENFNINRVYTSPEAQRALQHAELLDLVEITGYDGSCDDPCVLNNATLKRYQEKISIVSDLQTFNWCIGAYESPSLDLNSAIFADQLLNMGNLLNVTNRIKELLVRTEYAGLSYLCW